MDLRGAHSGSRAGAGLLAREAPELARGYKHGGVFSPGIWQGVIGTVQRIPVVDKMGNTPPPIENFH